MHNKSSRDDNEVVGISINIAQAEYFCLKYWLYTPKSFSGFKAIIIIVHAA